MACALLLGALIASQVFLSSLCSKASYGLTEHRTGFRSVWTSGSACEVCVSVCMSVFLGRELQLDQILNEVSGLQRVKKH